MAVCQSLPVIMVQGMSQLISSLLTEIMIIVSVVTPVQHSTRAFTDECVYITGFTSKVQHATSL